LGLLSFVEAQLRTGPGLKPGAFIQPCCATLDVGSLIRTVRLHVRAKDQILPESPIYICETATVA